MSAIDESAQATVPDNEESEDALLQEIRGAREDLAACPQGHPDRAKHAQYLGYLLEACYDQCGDLGLLDEAIELDREALALRPPGHPGRGDSCKNLASSLRERYKQCGDVGLLDEAIELEREVLDSPSLCHLHRAFSCENLGGSLRERYRHCSDVGLLDEAIELERKVLDLRPPGHPDRARSCANLGHSLSMRYNQCGDLDLLYKAIELEREALALRPPGHPDRAVSCDNLGYSLHLRYNQCGDLNLLDETIELDREALALRPLGHPKRLLSCANLAVLLHVRYDQCGDLDLLDEAIELKREALALQPPGHPNRADSCDNLGVSLCTRYQQGGDLRLLNEAIEFQREALALQPPGYLNRAVSCANLAISLYTRYTRCGNLSLLNEAIELEREALALRPPGHLSQSVSCINLSDSLMTYYGHTKNASLLDEAIKLCSHSLHHSPSLAWHSFLCLSQLYMIPDTFYFSLASALGYLKLSFASEFDNVHVFINKTRSILSDLWDASSVWASDTPLQLCNIYTQLIDRLPLAAGFALNTSSRLQTLKSTHHIGTDACTAAILAKQPSQAIEVLDRAHGIVWAQALHQRDPQTEGAPPELAAELADHLRAIAARASTQPAESSHLAHHQDARHRRNTRIQAILREIRAMPGRERFMLGASYDTLRMAAREHPVIVLVAGRCHAFALIMSNAAHDHPHELHLDLSSDDLSVLRVSAEQAGLRSRADMRNCDSGTRIRYQKTETDDNHKPHRVLREIWLKIIQPILRYLQLEVCMLTSCDPAQLTHITQKATGRARPRIHWCANGDFVFLPLHAAGIYSGPQASRECCSDYVVSSYTPTVSALLRAQAQAPAVRSADVDMLLVAEDSAKNPALSKLWSVRTELTRVESIATTKRFGNTVETIAKDATVERVTARIKSASFVHLACHGLQHRTNALESGFYLNDDKLTISKLMELHLDHPWFAYLSACETAKGDAEQPDQVMHLAAAMLFAGFKHVVATMWYAQLATHSIDNKLMMNTG
jgi:tetratricopeptide (TPR) repeat protein